MSSSQTFRERVLEFWNWFPTVSDRVRDAMASGNAQQELEFFIDEVQDKVGGLAWVFGPGSSEDRLSFTVSGEGQKPLQYLSKFWEQHAVDVPGWDFFASRQPSPIDQLSDFMIEVGGEKVDAESIILETTIDEENEQVDLKSWHPVFEQVDEDGRLQILFLLLDEALGEFGTQMRLGKLDFEPFTDGMPLLELPKYLDEVWEQKEWSQLSPLETHSLYKGEPTDQFERSDTFAGFTCVPHVVIGYLNNQGPMPMEENPLKDRGAELIYVVIEQSGLEHNPDSALDYRNEISDEIEKRLAGGGGEVVGAAMGTQNAYIDIISYDGKRSLAAIIEAIEKTHNGDYKIQPFFV